MERYHETMRKMKEEAAQQPDTGQRVSSSSLDDKSKWMTYQAEDPLDYAVNAALYPFNAAASEITKQGFRGASMLGLVSAKELAVIEKSM